MANGDAGVGKPNDQPAQPAPAPDNLQTARTPGPTDTTVVAQNTAQPHLTNLSIDQPYNPYNQAGTYQPADIQAAKAAGFNADEVHALEEGGGDRFHQIMGYYQARPDHQAGIKQMADLTVALQTHPDQPFNLFNAPGQYDQNALAFGKQAGFNSDQMHVLEQWGPQNFNGIMTYLQQNPNQVENFKNLANQVGYWEMHTDLPTTPGVDVVQPTPQALQVAQQQGFNQGQINVLKQWGGDNFNNTMAYLQQHPDQVNNYKGLANAVAVWDMQLYNQLKQQKQ